jgi:hypothetical protein
MSEAAKAADFLLTIGRKTPKELRDERWRLEETNDVDGLKRLLAAVDAEIVRKGENRDAAMVKERYWLDDSITSLERFEADNYQRAIRNAESTTLGLEEPLKSKFNLTAFQERVLDLFDWYDQRQSHFYMAPYFPMIQSSGTGKTRLLMALRDAARNDPNDGSFDCKTILCLPKAEQVYNRRKYYDETLHLPLGNRDIESTLTSLSRKSTKSKLVLLFDEAHRLLDDDAKAFRCIRWWLRAVRDRQVVAVFAGTSFQLAHVYSKNDFPTTGGFSRDAQTDYKNWREDARGPIKLYDPFFRICTMGCFQNDAPTDHDDDDLTEFQMAAYFGRPLFAYLEKINVLVYKDDTKLVGDDGIEITNSMLHGILQHMLASEVDWRNSTAAVYSILASRVQMGITTSWELSSTLVSQSYAHLVQFQLDDESGNVNQAMARITFMSDPVCAALAMGLMHEGWILKKNNDDGVAMPLTGETKQFWSQQAMELLKSNLCYSEKGDYGEIMAALYMLFCGDVLRYDTDKSLRSFSVSLTEWYTQMRNNKNIMEEKPKAANSGTQQLHMEVNFIQVCRNYLRSHSWRTQKALAFMYESATATYLHQNCTEIDLVASIRVMRDGKAFFHPLLVKVHYCMQMSNGEIEEAVVEMKTFLNDIRDVGDNDGDKESPNENKVDPFFLCPPALCLLVLLGVETQQTDSRPSKNQFNLEDLGSFPEADTFRVIPVPTDYLFGISKAVRFMNKDQEMSEVFASHGYVYGIDDDDDDDNETLSEVLRPRSQPDIVTKFVQSMFDGFN